MTDEEKVGQLFFENRGQSTDEALIELVQKYHIGGYRYNGIKKEVVQHNIRTLQENSKIPLFVACNTESGGNGSATDGTYLANGIKIGATGNVDYAYEMGRLGNEEAAMFPRMIWWPLTRRSMVRLSTRRIRMSLKYQSD